MVNVILFAGKDTVWVFSLIPNEWKISMTTALNAQ